MSGKQAYLATYMGLFFMIAVPLTSMGSLIPFLAQALNIDERQYSILFLMVSVASVASAFCYKLLESHHLLPGHHSVCLISMGGIIAMCIVMANAKTQMGQCLTVAVMEFFTYGLIISVNVCLMLVPAKEDIGRWMSYSHGFFGVGALAGPLLVGFFQQNVFYLIGLGILLAAPAFYYLPCPKEPIPDSQEKPLAYGSRNLEILISGGFFIVVGIEVTITGWLPTYAVLQQVSDKQAAVRFASIFWTLSTAFRFVFGYLKVPDSFKFSSLVLGQLITGGISLILAVGGLPSAAAYISSIFYGITLSLLFPLLLSISSEFGIHFTGSQVSNMILSTTISSGVFSSLAGVLMQWDLNMLFYCLLGFGILLFFNARAILRKLEEQGPKEAKSIELPLIGQ